MVFMAGIANFSAPAWSEDDLYEAIGQALAEKDVAKVSQLIRRGLSPDTASPAGYTLLMTAALEGDAP
ncbi:MAG TPA: hypothetical protein VN667_10305, partial [Burkholderiales bacterium]|nr:hypothetical protein [Burkholderiales bacterium]